MISEDFISELKRRCEIEYIISEYVELKRAGKNKIGRCPFHSEKTPSMVVYGDTQSFYCFGCGAGGDVITFIKNIENLDYVQAVAFLANKTGLAIPDQIQDDKKYILRKKLININKIAARHYFKNLTDPKSAIIKKYILSRQIQPKYVKKFGLGFAKDSWNDITNLLKSEGFSDEEILSSNLASRNKNGVLYDVFRNRLIFPIIDIAGNVIAFGGRKLDDTSPGPKYLNSSDTIIFKKSNNLFALNFCKNTKNNYIILTEGYMDTLSLYQSGFDNVVATLGTALTSQQARLISSYAPEVLISYDSDEAGQKAALRAINIFSNFGVSAKILDLKQAKDPDEYIKKFGKEKFFLEIKKSQNVFDFKLKKLKNKYNLYNSKDSQDKINFLKEVIDILSEISNPIEREVYISKISHDLDINRDTIAISVNKKIKKQINKNKKKQSEILNKINYNFDFNKLNNKNKDQIKSVVAENKIITILLKNPDFYKIAMLNLSPESFSDDINKKIYNIIIKRLEENLSIDITCLSNIIDEESIKKIAYLLATDLDINFSKQDFIDYIKVLENNKLNTNFSQMNEDQLKNFFLEIKKQKK